MRVSTPEPLIRPPLQRRSQESLERVLAAGIDVLVEEGFEGFTLQEVSRRAGVSIGSIYARVPSRDALLLALHGRVMDMLMEQERQFERDSELQGLSPRELVEKLVTDMANIMLRNRHLLLPFMRQAPSFPEIWQRGAESSQATGDLWESALLRHRAAVKHPDPELAIDVAYRMVYCTIARRITHGNTFESDREITDQDLVRELARAVADYLL
jgi:AcrR family transcriptional regulator